MKKNIQLPIFLLLAGLVTFASCEKTTPDPESQATLFAEPANCLMVNAPGFYTLLGEPMVKLSDITPYTPSTFGGGYNRLVINRIIEFCRGLRKEFRGFSCHAARTVILNKLSF